MTDKPAVYAIYIYILHGYKICSTKKIKARERERERERERVRGEGVGGSELSGLDKTSCSMCRVYYAYKDSTVQQSVCLITRSALNTIKYSTCSNKELKTLNCNKRKNKIGIDFDIRISNSGINN